MVNKITTNEFDERVKDGTVVIFFSAEWCGYCKPLYPFLDKLSESAEFKIYKVDIDEEPDIASRYKIKGIPAILVFKNGALDGQYSGTDKIRLVLNEL